MPNWCDNKLVVTGPNAEFKKFLESITVPMSEDEMQQEGETTKIDFTVLHPIPEDKANNNSLTNGWYDWCCSNWGTKWPPSRVGYDDDRMFAFDTAWAPPIELFTHISTLFPRLTFTLSYCESGVCFAGKDEIKDGDVENIVNGWEEDDALEIRNKFGAIYCASCYCLLSLEYITRCAKCGAIHCGDCLSDTGTDNRFSLCNNCYEAWKVDSMLGLVSVVEMFNQIIATNNVELLTNLDNEMLTLLDKHVTNEKLKQAIENQIKEK